MGSRWGAHRHISSIAAPRQCRSREPDEGDALCVRPMRRVESYAAHTEVMLLQQAQQPLLAGACVLRPCSRNSLSSG